MPILRTEREQCELRAGGNALGGESPNSVQLTDLSVFPLVGTIVVAGNVPPTIQRLSSAVTVMVGGVMLGAAPTRLTNGATIQVGSVRMTFYEHADAVEQVMTDVPRRRKESDLATQLMPAIGAPARPAALTAVESGHMIRLPGRDVVIGRSEDADVVLTGQGVSRRHAVVRVEGDGYALADESTNGTFVNGARVSGRTLLNAGDMIAFGDEQYRFDYIDADRGQRRSSGSRANGDGPAPPTAPLAELEVVRGRAKRKIYAIDRAVCALGRGTHNDVSLEDESVSPSHATLLLKGDTWYLTDLRSVSGTYVDGYRVAGERALAAGSVIRVGQVALAFKPRIARTQTPGVRARGGVLRSIARAIFS